MILRRCLTIENIKKLYNLIGLRVDRIRELILNHFNPLLIKSEIEHLIGSPTF